MDDIRTAVPKTRTEALPETEVITKDAIPKEETETPKKRKTRAAKARDYTELLEVPTKSLSEKETKILVEGLKEACDAAAAKIEALEANCEAAYKQADTAQKQVKECEVFYMAKLKTLTDMVLANANATVEITKGLV